MKKNEARKGHELRYYLVVIKRWLWLLGVCTVLMAGAAYAISKLQTPVYRATTLLVVDQQAAGQDTYSNLLASDQLVQTYVNLIDQPAVLQKASHQIGGTSAPALASKMQVSAQTDTQVIQLEVDDTNPARAAALANAIATAFIAVQQQSAQAEFTDAAQQLNQELTQVTAQINGLASQIDTLQASDPSSPQVQVLQQQLDNALTHRTTLQTVNAQLIVQNLAANNNIRIFQPAVPPSSPDHPKPTTNGAIGGALGLVLAASAVFLLEILDDRVRTVEEVEALTGLPTVGTVSTQRKRSLLLSANSSSLLAESFRILRTNLSFVSLDKPLHTIVVTSAAPGDGKTTVATNLAISLAQSGRRVLLIDADLRHPSVHKLLDIANIGGLALCLLGESPRFPFATLPDVPNLYVLVAGAKPPNPTELLGSERMYQFLQSVLGTDQHQGLVDVVVMDTPPAIAFADAIVLAGRADGTILVTNAAQSREGQLMRVVDALQWVNARVVGVVLNRVTPKREEDYYYYKYYSQEVTGEHAATPHT
jgi:succinoglycan biosynthesis transport protein ExoP